MGFCFLPWLSLALLETQMIACRPLSRVDSLWKAGRVANALSNPPFYSQGCFHDHSLSWVMKMGREKDGSNSMNRHKKQKATMPVWRPVSTQSGSHEACIVKELRTNLRYPYEAVGCSERSDVGCQVHEVHNNMSSCIPDSQNFSQDESISGEQAKGEILHDLGSEKDAEPANRVGKHSVSVAVDASLIRFIKGKGGSTQKQIEEEAGVKIIFPSSKEDTFIVIEGISTESVTGASTKIASVLEEAVKSPNLDYSHFISLPLAIHPELVEKLQNFQNFILGDATSSHDGNLDGDSTEDTSDDEDSEDKQSESPNVAVKLEVQGGKEHVTVKIDTKRKADILSDMGIDKSIFIKPKTFHLTVLMLKLWNKDRIAAATEVLQRISSKVNDALDNRPISIKLKGLECMRGSPAKARVLYAPVKEVGAEGRLLHACQVIIDGYVEAGLVLEKDARQALKLHATLMNARHRKSKKRTRRHDSFDACWILKRYGLEEWGDYLIREAHLSQRFSFDESGYYHCCASIPFPESMQDE